MSEQKKLDNSTEIGMPEVIYSFLANKNFSVTALKKFDNNTEFIFIEAKDLLEAVTFLKMHKETQFDLLYSISGVDYPDKYELIYHIQSTKLNKKCVLKTQIDKNNPEIDSLANLYQTANWHERETYDLLGIKFNSHPNLTRILLSNDWKGHPLRKDYVMDDERLIWNER